MSFNAACFRGLSKAQMSNLDAFSAAAPPNSRRENEGFGGESLVVVRKLERRRRLLDFDLNVAPPEAADCEVAAGEGGGGNGAESPPADVSAKKAEISGGGEANFDVELKTEEIGADAEEDAWNRRWIALLGVAENALREKKEEEFRRGGEEANRRRIGGGGQRRHGLVEEWSNNGEVVVRSTRGRAVAMPSKYRDSVLGSAAAELPRSRSGKSATVFCTKRKSR